MKEKLKLIILADNKTDFDFIANETNKLEYKIELKQVYDKEEFQNKLNEFDPDLVIADHNISQLSDMEALLMLQEKAPHIPFIIIFNSINNDLATEYIKAGAFDYVHKEHFYRLTLSVISAIRNLKIFKEKEKAHKSLELSLRKYTTLVEKSADPILIIQDGIFVDCNDAAVKFLKYDSKEEIINTPPYDQSPEYQPDGQRSINKAKQMIEIAIKDGRNYFEWVHTQKDGTEKWVDVSLTYIQDNEGDSIHTIWRDISERKKAEKTQEVLFKISEVIEVSDSLEDILKKIHLLLGNIINNENFYVALYNEQNDTYTFPIYIDKYDSLDPNEEQVSHKSLTDYIRRTGKALLVTEELEAELNKKEEIILIGEPSPIWLGAPLIDTDSNKIIGIIGIQHYEDKNAYDESDLELLKYVARNIGTLIARKKSEILLKESEEQFRTLTETATDGIIMLNEKGNISVWNKSAERIFGYTFNEAIGKDVHDFLVPKQYLSKAKPAFESFLQTGKGDLIGKTVEITGKRKDGSLFPVELSISKINKENGWFATGIIRDITDRKYAELELKKAKEKAEESDKLKTAFLANMSHEIRTPMNAILGFSELLALPDIEDEEKIEFIKLIQNNSNLLLNLINDIIDIAKIEAGLLNIYTNDFSIKDLLDDLLKTYSEIKLNMGKSEIELSLNFPDYLKNLIINSDPNRVKQVISNLFGNALKYTEKGSIELGCYFTKLADSHNELIFYVKDTGIGIPEEKLNVIFDRFRQADDSYTRVYGGTGLGLAISNNIAKLLGGNIRVESKVKSGSTFYFSLPISEIIDTTDVTKEDTKKKPATNDYTGIKILVAEDVESNFQLLRTYLKKTNAEIHWVKNGKEAVEFFKQNKDISIILMDMQMPLLNGYEATKQIKAINPDIPIIAETAFALAGDKDKIIAAGCDDYISKPIRANELYSAINKLLKL